MPQTESIRTGESTTRAGNRSRSTLRLEPQAEVLPGYRLIERLGSGGFGEVWKAEAPGGLLKAIKVVFGDLGSEEEINLQRAEQELNALRRVQSVRHPFLLSLERYDIVDGRLVIVMELADCNLGDRFQECRQRRLPGIPRDDLLRYLQEAAEVLDLMNAQHQLQHLDIKPQNLFLVHDHVKVADFGLVKDLSGVKAARSEGGVTPVYAAPETFDGHVSPFCDQYSLAIVYQELLSGKRPFPASNVQQLIAQHLQAAPDLSPLPPGDRAAVAKALCKRPEDRHLNCMAFVRALQAGGATLLPQPPAGPIRSPLHTPEEVNVALQWNETPATMRHVRFEEDRAPQESAAPMPAPPEQAGDGVLFPALVIALGRTGLEVLLRTRLALQDRYSPLSRLPNIRFLFVDTDPETTESVVQLDAPCPLDADEVFAARLNRPGHYLKPRRSGRSLIEGWFDPQLLYRIKAGNPLTQGMRALGRLAFLDHYQELEEKVRRELEACLDPNVLDHAVAQTSLGVRSNRPRVYVLAGLAGGTGGGMFIDMAYLVRQHLKNFGYENPDVVGLFLVPPCSGNSVRTIALGNTYAALTELNHFSLPGIPYSAGVDEREVTLQDDSAPFSRFHLLSLRPTSAHSNEHASMQLAAEWLWRDMVTPLGRVADDCRIDVSALPGVAPDSMTVAGQSFGLFALSWPRRILQDRTARWLCHHILENWLSQDYAVFRGPVQEWVQSQWSELNFDADQLVANFRQICERVLGQPFERFVGAAVDPLVPKSRWSRSTYDPSAIWQTVSQCAQYLGQHGDLSATRQPGQFDAVIGQAAEALRKEWGEKVVQIAMCLLEQPDYRLPGAEESYRYLAQVLGSALKDFEARSAAASELMDAAYAQLQDLLARDTRRKMGADVADRLRTYLRARLEWLIHRNVLRVYAHLFEQVDDAGQKLDLCRQRLGELFKQFHPGTAPRSEPGALLPEGCTDIEDAVQLYLQRVTADELSELEAQMQTLVEQQFTSLAHVCLSSADLIWGLKSAMLQLAKRSVQFRLEEADVAAMYLARNGNEETGRRLLASAFAEAETSLEAPDAPPDSAQILAVPISEATEQFLDLVSTSLPTTHLTVTSSPDDIIFYREQVTVPLKRLPQLGPIGRTAYEQMQAQQFPPHARLDIRQWYDPGLM